MLLTISPRFLFIFQFLAPGLPRAYHFSAYHGHVSSVMDISPYKLKTNVDGMHPMPTHVHVVSCVKHSDYLEGSPLMWMFLLHLHVKSEN